MLINPSRQHYHQPFLTSPDRSSGSGGTTALMRNRRYQALIVGCGVLLAVLIIYQMVTAMSTETKEDGSTESPAPNRHIGRLMKDAEELERASASATTKKPETTTTTTKTQSEAIPVLPLLFTMVGRDDMKRVRELVGVCPRLSYGRS